MEQVNSYTAPMYDKINSATVDYNQKALELLSKLVEYKDHYLEVGKNSKYVQ